MTRRALGALRTLLILLFAGAVAAQVTVWPVASEALGRAAESGGIGWPSAGVAAALVVVVTALVVCGALAVEVVLVSAWMLVDLVPGDAIFDGQRHADRWANRARAALRAGSGLAAAGLVFFAVVQLSAPTPEGVVLCVLAGAAAGVGATLALLVGVMRRLLHTAIRLQGELDEVI